VLSDKELPFEKKGRERFLEKLREAELEMQRDEEEDVRERLLIWEGRVSHEHETDAAIFLCERMKGPFSLFIRWGEGMMIVIC